MSRLYTGIGDNGTTNLYDMRAIGKEDLHIEVLGDLDELSAHIGVACATQAAQIFPNSMNMLRNIQARLLDIGSDIAIVKNRTKVVEITEDDVKNLEVYIDELCSKTAKLTEFILPGWREFDAQLHVCRSVCRRAERHMWALRKSDDSLATRSDTFRYMNRLSDFFFAMARVFSCGNEITRSAAKNLSSE